MRNLISRKPIALLISIWEIQRSTGVNGRMSEIRVVTPHEGPYGKRAVLPPYFMHRFV